MRSSPGFCRPWTPAIERACRALPRRPLRPARVPLRVQDPLTVERAIDRLAEAAQSVVADQIEGARLEVKVVVSRILRSAALLIAGARVMKDHGHD